MRIGLFGFPQTGKTTIFQLLTGTTAPASYLARGEARVGVSWVPDPRLERLAALYSPKKTTPATVEYLDLTAIKNRHTSPFAAALQSRPHLGQSGALDYTPRGVRAPLPPAT